MRHFSGILILAGAFILAFTIAAPAQMGMSGQKGKVMPMMTDSTGQHMRTADDSKLLMDEFTKIQADFDRIMKITDQQELKAEMAKHKQMMMAFQKQLQKHQSMYQAMMEKQYGNMHHNVGVMGTKSTDDPKTKKTDDKK
jgi:hypothetical protein